MRAILIASLLLTIAPAAAESTRSWTAHPATLGRGDADGVSISRQGKLALAPRLSRLLDEGISGDAEQVWSIASDRAGNIFLGTGPEGRILKVTPGGRVTTWFVADEPLVTALAVTADGNLLAAGAPGGLIYRIDGEGAGGAWTDSGAGYVWALAAGRDGIVYAATGERGAVVKINPTGSVEPFFDSGESHIVSLALRADGSMLAGGAGRGLVYDVDVEGNALVRYGDELDEVVGLAEEPDGAVIAALISAPAPERRPPALRLRLPDGVEVGATADPVAALDESEGSTLHGVIEGLPAGHDGDKRGLRGRVVRIGPQGDATVLWSSATETPYSLVQTADGRVLLGTGEPARLYAIEGEDVVLLTTLPESQITELIGANGSPVLATSNPVAAYRIEKGPIDAGVFISQPFDAGAPARWGSIRWSVEGGGTELYTRTGNSEFPDDTWSAWSPSMIDGAGSRIDNPDGRFLQWRVRFLGGSAEARISEVTVDYAIHNRPPEARDFGSASDARAVTGKATFHCTLSDPDHDALDVRLEFRPAGHDGWLPVAGAAQPEDDPLQPVEGWRKKELTWETAAVDEGRYEVRAWVSDQPSNHPGEGRRVPLGPLSLTVDRTPPKMDIRQSDGRVEVTLTDAWSEIRRLQIRDASGRTLATVRSEDGVCDSREERFVLAPTDEDSPRVLLGADAAGNTVELPLLAR